MFKPRGSLIGEKKHFLRRSAKIRVYQLFCKGVAECPCKAKWPGPLVSKQGRKDAKWYPRRTWSRWLWASQLSHTSPTVMSIRTLTQKLEAGNYTEKCVAVNLQVRSFLSSTKGGPATPLMNLTQSMLMGGASIKIRLRTSPSLSTFSPWHNISAVTKGVCPACTEESGADGTGWSLALELITPIVSVSVQLVTNWLV